MQAIKKILLYLLILNMMLVQALALYKIFYAINTENVFAVLGSKEIVGKIIDKSHNKGKRRKDFIYYITYSFTPENSSAIEERISVSHGEWEFMKKDQPIVILYQEYRGEIFHRPQFWEIASGDIYLTLTMLSMSTAIMLIAFSALRRIKSPQ